MNNDIRFYISVFLRRIHYFLIVALVVSAAGVTTAILLPTKYRADAILLVESPQIPTDLAASTVQTSPQEQLEIIRQRLLTRNILLDIADETNVFENRSELFPDEVVAQMRAATTFNISTGRDRASLVTIGFEAERPTAAAAVVNAYVTEVQRNNTELRTTRAESTMDFFEQEVARLADDLSRKSAEILQFKNANLDALPENLSYQLSRLDDLRDRASDIGREISSLAQQRERLILVFKATGGAMGGQDLRSPEQRQLDEANKELASALTIYSEQNPRIKALRARIATLEEAVSSQNETQGPRETPQADTLLDIQLGEIDARIEQLQVERGKLQEEIESLQASVEAVPSNSVTLDALLRDYENIQNQYNTTVARASAAATGERIELLAKGERISVLSQPVVPREPSSPNRPMIAAAGIGAGIAGGIAFVVLLELLNRSIRRPVDLTRALGITPLLTLPMMRTPQEVVLRRGLVVGFLVVGTTTVVAALFYLHTQVMPIDLLAAKAINKIGL